MTLHMFDEQAYDNESAIEQLTGSGLLDVDVHLNGAVLVKEIGSDFCGRVGKAYLRSKDAIRWRPSQAGWRPLLLVTRSY